MENKQKYPRTFHLPYSEKKGDDDKTLENDDCFYNMHVIVLEKLDGENTSLYGDYMHARSLDSLIDDEGRRWVETFMKVRQSHFINDMVILGENMFYKHTVEYDDLESYFYGFSIRTNQLFLDWALTTRVFKKMDIKHPKVIYKGIYDKDAILEAFRDYDDSKNNRCEGFVVRNSDIFRMPNFSSNVAKFVKSSFVLPDQHWRHAPKIINKNINNLNPWEILHIQDTKTY